jgi:putative endonuclease
MAGVRRPGFFRLFVGVRRVYEHKEKSTPDFSSRYGTERLGWFEADEAVTVAIEREKEIKKWKRSWKLAFIEKHNSDWSDRDDSICSQAALDSGFGASRRPGMTMS